MLASFEYAQNIAITTITNATLVIQNEAFRMDCLMI